MDLADVDGTGGKQRMRDAFARVLAGREALLLAVLWLLAWLLPWPAWLEALPWVRAGLAFLLLAFPGLTTSMLLAGSRLTLVAHFIIGLVVSVLIVSLLGLLGRILHLTFDYIRPVFVLAGLLGAGLMMRRSRSEAAFVHIGRISFGTLAAFLIMAVLAVLVGLQSRFSGDDLSYLAYLTTWLHADPLNFHEVVFASGGLDAVRFWTAVFPMTTAFLAQTSHLHGLLLLGLYLEPFLVVCALLAAYSLYRELLPSSAHALGALAIQLTLLYLLRATQQPGSAFFNRLSEDKSFGAFVVAPAFLLALQLALESLNLRTGLLLLLSGLALSFVHPVILAYGLFIAGVYVTLSTLPQRDFRQLAILGMLLGLTLLPSAPLRFVHVASSPSSFDLDSALEADSRVTDTRISYIEGTPFYGFQLERIKIELEGVTATGPAQALGSWSYVVLLAAGLVWAAARVRQNKAAPLLAASITLVAICAIPFTGWLVGYLVTARMLWRSPWLMPAGLLVMAMLVDLAAYALRKLPAGSRLRSLEPRAIKGLALAGCLALAAVFSARVYTDSRQRLATLPAYAAGLESRVSLGTYLEQNIDRPARFLAPGGLLNYLPGLSSKSKVAFFRFPTLTERFLPIHIDSRQMRQMLSAKSPVSFGERLRMLRKFQIEYIITENESLKDVYLRRPDLFSAERFNGLWIIKFQDGGS